MKKNDNKSGTTTINSTQGLSNEFNGKIIIETNCNIILATLGNAEELILGANSIVKIVDLNNREFTNFTDKVKTIILSGENTTSDEQDNPYA